MHKYAERSHTHVKDHVRSPCQEFGGFWKSQNNPACTKYVSVQNVEEEAELRLSVSHCQWCLSAFCPPVSGVPQVSVLLLGPHSFV